MKNKGFTLIELLAVIIILGVLMIIAIPSVTEYINSSRKNSYIVTVQGFIDGMTSKVNSLEYSVMDTEVTYYIPTKCISLEKGGDSPFGEFEESYVVVTYDGIGYDYYYTGRDSGNHGIKLTYRDLLENSYIETGVKTIDTTVGVGSREKIIIFSDTCDTDLYEEKTATKMIEENSSLKNGTEEIEAETSASCFVFNEENGAISDYLCGKSSSTPVLDVVIPKKINGVTVSIIKEYTFNYSDEIQTIEIPSTITTIEESAIRENWTLYNIINKTGKEFNWYKILGIYINESFEIGEVSYNQESMCATTKEYLVHVTKNPIEKIDIDGMFDISDKNVILKNNMGYDVYYSNESPIETWKPFVVGTTNSAKSCEDLRIKIEKNGTTIFSGSLIPISCPC